MLVEGIDSTLRTGVTTTKTIGEACFRGWQVWRPP
jgi:hypothetical protein